MIAINGMPDHIHVFMGINPKQSISDLMQDIKGDSSKWINNNQFVRSHFEWQSGYGAFSYGHSQIDSVVKYIQQQETHHRRRSFLDEYTAFLQKFNVPYDERYLFKPLDE